MPFLVFALVLIGLWFIERGILHLECAFLGFCACVGLWFIERRILHLECAFLGFCTCVGFTVYRTTNITFFSAPFLVFALVLVYGL